MAPVEPDADTARRWATEELARGIYTERTGLLDRFVTWLLERLDALSELSVSDAGWVLPTAAVVVTAAAVVIGLVVGPPARRRRAAAGRRAVLDDEDRSAEQLRSSADESAAAGDFAAAVLDRFRAIIRSLADRALIEERPGLTAHEAAEEAAQRLPGLEADLLAASVVFDRVCYGRRTAEAGDVARMRALDETVAATRPSARQQARAEP